MSARGNRLVLVIACLVSGWLALHSSLVAASDRRALRSAVVRITTPGHGSCTAVCVSPQGHLLSVAHCRSGDRSLATINGRRHPLRVLHAPPAGQFQRGDPPVVLQLRNVETMSYVPIAQEAPRAGESVFAIGFPAGQYAYHEGRVRGVVQQNGQMLIQTTFRVFEGHSGGPLFNAAGELVGLASSRSAMPGERGYRGDPPASYWVHTADLRRAMKQAGATTTVKPPRTLYVFSATACVSCRYVRRFEQRLRDAWKPHGDVVFLELGTARFRTVAAQCRQATGSPVTAVPTFWVEGTTIVENDYRDFGKLAGEFNVLAVVRWAVHAVARFLVGKLRDSRKEKPRVPETPSPPLPSPSPIPDATEPDWSAVTLILLIAKQETDLAKSLGARIGLRLANGPLRRRVDRALGARVAVRLVAQRLTPRRFAAVAKAAELDVARAALVVLIEKQPVGMFRGLERRIAEKILLGRLKDAPVDLVFERTHPDTFAAVRAALTIVDDSSAESLIVPPDDSLRRELLERLDALSSRPHQPTAGDGREHERWALVNSFLGGGGLLAGLFALWKRRRIKPIPIDQAE